MSFITSGNGGGGGGSPSAVTGPGPGASTSTDNAIARWDGTNGIVIQDSTVTIADTTGAMTFTAGSGADILWTTDGAGSIGADLATRPANIRATTEISIKNNTNSFFRSWAASATASNQPFYQLAKIRGTQAAPAYLNSADLTGVLQFSSWNGTTVTRTIAKIQGIASENHSASAAGMDMQFHCIVPTTTTNTLQLTIEGSGQLRMGRSTNANIIWNTDGAGDIGASGATRPNNIWIKNNANIDTLTASTALVSDASKNVISSAVTTTELGYLSGVTSAIQTQLDAKVATSGRLKLSRVAVADADYTVLTSDYYVGLSSITVSRTFTLPAAATAGNGSILVFKDESGSVSGTVKLIIDANASETIDGATTFEMTSAYESISLMCNGSNWFII